jgi:mRNA deadenylase 3'-5' endonuclease subunit Ccr4
MLRSIFCFCLSKESITNFVESTETNNSFCGTLDYIFFNPNLKIRAVRELPNQQEISSEFALPNNVFPSDHLPLQAIFSFTNSEFTN